MSGAPAADPIRRSFEIEDPTNLYFIHPISARLVPIFARQGVTPNAVSLIGMGSGVLAGGFYGFYHHLWCDLAGLALMLIWHVMDGADGQLARLTQTYSEFGKILDGICDYVTFAAVYIGLGLASSGHHGGWIWTVIGLSGICHAVQSATYELQRQNYNFWGWGRQSAALPALETPAPGQPWHRRLTGEMNRLYTRVQLWAGGGANIFDAQFAALLAAQPARQAALREEYRAFFAPIIRRWGVLSANYRTLGIFIAAALQLPLLYFAWEIAGFSLILVWLLRAQKTQKQTFLQRLRHDAALHPVMSAFQQPHT